MAPTEAKVIFLGDSGVGKTTFISKLCKKQRQIDRTPTITPCYVVTDVRLASGCTQRLALWDTAGQEKFRAMLPMYYRSVNAAVIMYDVTNVDTFLAADTWLHELRRYQPNIPTVILVGNKTDQCCREVKTEEARAFADQRGLLFWEVSVLTSRLTPLILSLVQDLLTKLGRRDQQMEPLDFDDSVKLKKGCLETCCWK